MGSRSNPFSGIAVHEPDAVEPGPTMMDRLKTALTEKYWEDADENDIRDFIEKCDSLGIAIVDMDGM